MNFIPISDKPPVENKFVLIRGWRDESKTQYMYKFAYFKKTNSGGYCWYDENDDELWFEPIEWAELEQPKCKIKK